ncbi:MAG: sulfotransferase [Deinococcota bacterium]
MPDDSSPIFILGTGRSGTSLLRAILNAHPRVYLTFEASFFSFTPQVYQAAYQHGQDWFRRYQRSLAFAWLRLEPRSIEGQLAALRYRPSVADAMQTILKTKARQYERTHIGDKTPTSILYLSKLWDSFPAAKVIHVVRDPRAVITSLMQMPWAPPGTLLNALFVRHMLSKVPQAHSQLLEVKLESLLANPEGILRRILAFLDLSWDERVLEHHNHSPVDSPPFLWLQSAHQPLQLRQPPSLSWQTELTTSEIAIIEGLLAPFIRRYGYRASGVHSQVKKLDVLRQVMADSRLLPYTLLHGHRMLHCLRQTSPPDVSALLKFFMTMNPRVSFDKNDLERFLKWLGDD